MPPIVAGQWGLATGKIVAWSELATALKTLTFMPNAKHNQGSGAARTPTQAIAGLQTE
jgi:hypothetical protein